MYIKELRIIRKLLKFFILYNIINFLPFCIQFPQYKFISNDIID